QVARLSESSPGSPRPDSYYQHQAEFFFIFILEGSIALDCAAHSPKVLATGDSFVVPAGLNFRFTHPSDDVQLLQVVLPADFEIEGI
ncbi:MAG: cupin domain-containing protein, partial [Nitrospinae bacterium]|nr:cupin domain-containing protein [Nitrospinota bacterium]